MTEIDTAEIRHTVDNEVDGMWLGENAMWLRKQVKTLCDEIDRLRAENLRLVNLGIALRNCLASLRSAKDEVSEAKIIEKCAQIAMSRPARHSAHDAAHSIRQYGNERALERIWEAHKATRLKEKP